VSLPPEVEQMLDKRTGMGVLGDMNQYTKFQAANAIGDAAKNPGGVAGLGASLSAGMAIGQQMAGAIGGAMQAPQQAAAPVAPPPTASTYFVAIDGKQAGPFDLATLANQARNGQLQRSSLVWKQGMPSWAAAETVPDLQGLFAAMPPPLPPQ
jgi:hypothetical protein